MNAFQFHKSWIVLFIWVIATPFLVRYPHPGVYEGGRSKDPLERIKRNTSAVAAILGEFRTGMSDVMFLKVERYLHGGVAYEAHDDPRSGSSAAAIREFEENEAAIRGESHPHGHAKIVTLVRPGHEDYRGFIGKLHREVVPWADPREGHRHSTGTELLPWFKLMTLSDPHYVRGYVLGAFWLKSIDLEEAIRFINQGIEKNPDAFQVYYMKGTLLMEKSRRIAEGEISDQHTAMFWGDLARHQFRKAMELAVKVRPTSESDPNAAAWTAYMENDAIASVRMAVLLERDMGNMNEAIRIAREYAPYFGADDVVLRKFLSIEPGTDNQPE